MKLRFFTLFCLLPLALAAQDASLTLAGTVVNTRTGEPLSRALVTIRGFVIQPDTARASPDAFSKPIDRSMMTDASGAFRFSALPAANYVVRAEKPGFAPGTNTSQTHPALELKSSIENVRIGVPPLGVITGKVVDQDGEPMRGVQINLLSSRIVDGQREIRQLRSVTTDDLGAYRFWNLPPGKYYVKASGQGLGTLLPGHADGLRFDVGDSFMPVYPGGGQTADSAKPVELGTSNDASVDFRLKLEPAWRVDGVLRNFTPRESVTFSILVNGEEVPAGPDRFNRDTGAFEFKDVVSGSYMLLARQEGKAGRVAFSVSGTDATEVTLTLNPPVDIPVIMRFTNSAPKPVDPAGAGLADGDPRFDVVNRGDTGPPCGIYLITAQPIGSVGQTQNVSERDGALKSVFPGRYRLATECFGEAYVRSALSGAQDLLANPALVIEDGTKPPPIEILATYGGGTINGKIDGTPEPGQIQILLVPQFTASAGPQHQASLLGPDGNNFEFAGLAPGSYTVYAFANPDIEYRDPAFLQALSGGENVQIDGDAPKEVTIHQVIQ